MEENSSFLGQGWSFPPRFDRKLNRLEMVDMEEDIRESLYILMSTTPGERITNPKYGCNLHDLIYRPIDKTTKYLIREAINMAVVRYEPRVQLEDIHIDTDEKEGVVYVSLEYTIRKINVRTNMVYPYYKVEGTDIVET